MNISPQQVATAIAKEYLRNNSSHMDRLIAQGTLLRPKQAADMLCKSQHSLKQLPIPTYNEGGERGTKYRLSDLIAHIDENQGK